MSVPKEVFESIDKYLKSGKVWWHKPIIIRILGKKIFHWYGTPVAREMDFDMFDNNVSKDGKYEHKSWTEFYRKRLVTCPKQYWFREVFLHEISLWFRVKKHQLDDLKITLKCLFKPFNVIKLRKQKFNQYSDTVWQLPEVMFQMFEDYMMIEKPFEHFDYDYIPWAKASEDKRNGFPDKKDYEKYWSERLDKKKQYFACLNWIQEGRQKEEKKVNTLLTKASSNRKLKKYKLGDCYKKYNEAEKTLENKNTEWLKWIVENHRDFWT